MCNSRSDEEVLARYRKLLEESKRNLDQGFDGDSFLTNVYQNNESPIDQTELTVITIKNEIVRLAKETLNDKKINMEVSVSDKKIANGALSLFINFEVGDTPDTYTNRKILIFIVNDFKTRMFSIIISNDSTEDLSIIYTNHAINPIPSIQKYFPAIVRSAIGVLRKRGNLE